MLAYTNGTGVPLSVAVFLATDHYDHDPSAISATTLLRPIRQTILGSRVPEDLAQVDILSLVKSRMGTAIHDGIERAWKQNYVRAMKSLGYPDHVIERVVVNPEPGTELPEDAIPVYMENREYRTLNGVTISGKYDFVAEGRLEDFKSTTTYTWINSNKDEDYCLQGSIYRWLNPKIITQDHMAIQFIFTDWMPGRAMQDPNYPNRPIEPRLIPLMSLDKTEEYIAGRLEDLQRYRDVAEEELPLCSDKDLWRKDPTFKYYKNPEKRQRSTKNFDNAADAYDRLAQDGNVGVVVEVPGQVTACHYCKAFPICSQKDSLIANGSLQL